MVISLKAARVNAGLTLNDVCKALKCSKNTVVAMENGKTDIKVSTLDALCKLYGCTRDDIFLPRVHTLSENWLREIR